MRTRIALFLGTALIVPQCAIADQQGVAGSPVLNAIVAREFSKPITMAPGPIPPPATDAQRKQFLAELGRVQHRLESVELGNSILRANNKMVGVILSAGKSPDWSGGVLRPVNAGMDQLFKWVEAEAEASLSREKTKLYGGLFAKSRLQDRNAFNTAFGGQITHKNFEKARLLVEGHSGPLAQAAANARPEDRKTIIDQQIVILNAGLTNSVALQQSDREKVGAQIDAANAKIDSIAKSFSDFKIATDKEVRAIKNAHNALSETVKTIDQKVGSNTADIGFMQNVLWGRMSAKEQRIAVQNGGFFKTMPADERKALVKQLEITENADELRANFSTANQIVDFASKLGVLSPADAANFQKNVQTAEVAVNIAANIITMNWMGAIGAASGILGGGGIEAGQANHAETMAQLRDIKKLLETSIKISEDTLAEVRHLRKEIAYRFNLVDRRFDELQVLITSDAWAKYEACQNFVSSSYSPLYVGKGGAFNSYAERIRHFNARRADYDICLSGLHLLLAPSAGQHAHFLGTSLKGQFDRGQNLRTPIFEAMKSQTWRALGATNISQEERCADQFFSVFVSASVNNPPKRGLVCDDAQVSKLGPYISASFIAHSGSSLLQKELYPPFINSITGILLHLSPYRELVVWKDGALWLKSEDEIRNAKVDPVAAATDVDPLVLLDQHIDVLNVAMAQQYLLSGVPLANSALKWLSEDEFGYAIKGEDRKPIEKELAALNDALRSRNDAKTQTSNEVTAAVKALWARLDVRPDAQDDERREIETACRFKDRYLTTSCLLASSAEFRKNLGVELGRLIVEENSMHEYAAALGGPVNGSMSILLSKPKLKWLADGKPRFRTVQVEGARYPTWFLEVRTVRGNVDIELPTPREAANGLYMMTLNWQELDRARFDAATRKLGLSAHQLSHVVKDAADKAILRRIGINNPALALIQVASPRIANSQN
ncbi:hypothetical protein ACERNI_13480 [Camelimonas sp. ID_303_24]